MSKQIDFLKRCIALNLQSGGLLDLLDRIEELERDQLRAKINVLREALSSAESALDESRDYPVTYDEVITALITTPEQSLAAYRNKVIEECAAVLNVVITRLSSCGASIKNDVAISTLKEQSCRLRAIKELHK